MYQAEPLHKSEVGTVPMLAFQVSMASVVPSPPHLLPRGATCWNAVASPQGSALLNDCYFSLIFCEADLCIDIGKRDPLLSYVSEVDLYFSYFMRRILATSNAPLDSFCSWDLDSLLKVPYPTRSWLSHWGGCSPVSFSLSTINLSS